MKNLILLSLLGFFVTTCQKPGPKMNIPMPEAQKIEKTLEIHGHSRIDPYYWLNDRTNPEVIAYLKEENAYLDTMMSHTSALQEKLFEEMKGRIKQDDQSAPLLNNGYYYYTRYEQGAEYPIFCRKKGSTDAEEEIMLNANELAKPHPYFNVGDYDVSPDNRWVAYSIDTVGRRMYTLMIKNLETGNTIATGIKHAEGDVVWAADNKTLFFTTIDPITLRSERIKRYSVGQKGNAVEVYYEADPTYSTGIWRSKAHQYLVITSRSTLSTESQVLEANNPTGKFRMVHGRERDLIYHITPYHDKFYVLTNWDAKNFRLMSTPANATSKTSWTEEIEHRPEVLLEGVGIFENYLVAQERTRGLRQLRVQHLPDGAEHYVNFNEDAYTASIGANAEMNSEVLRYNYTSLTTPGSVFDYHMSTRQTTLVKQQEVLGGFSSDNFETKRLFATATDGTEVPVTLLYRKGLKLNGKNPLLLYGYGSYGYSMEPRFNSNVISLVERGFVFALAHIRGGQDMGRQWYEDGKLLKKKNTFTDFIACAEFLVKTKYTDPSVLFASGGSAGGLLMGAVVNMKPELFKGVIAAVPFVDVVTTMLDETIPLTTSEYDEWGNPNEKEYYDYMLSYSPYDNVEKKAYPNLLVTTGLHDSQVQYWEPAKWVAKLRNFNTSDNMVLLYTNMDAGHGGASGRFRRIRETAREYAFLLDLAGTKK